MPAALYEHFIEREPASAWYRLHIRRAVLFGTVSAAIGFVALLWPLAFSLIFANPAATLAFYSLAIVLDLALCGIWLTSALRYSKFAARGESFELRRIPAMPTRTVPAKR